MSDQPRVTELWIYPIKSCRGIRLEKLVMNEAGPEYDRQWMIVDSANKFVTLRNQSKLALIKTSIDGKYLNLTFDSKSFSISLSDECSRLEDVTVWSDTFPAGVESDQINQALSDFLVQDVKLVRYQKESFRDLQKGATESVKQTRFADARPLLLINENSLEDLNQKLISAGLSPSVIERFRSNIVIAGAPAFAEDDAVEVQIGNINLKNPKLCARCVVITQDENTGKIISKETLTTLAGYRRINGNKVMFGVDWTPANLGFISVGDSVRLIK